MFCDNTIAYTEPEAGTLPDLSGSREGIEDLSQTLLVHSRPIVFERDPDIVVHLVRFNK